MARQSALLGGVGLLAGGCLLALAWSADATDLPAAAPPAAATRESPPARAAALAAPATEVVLAARQEAPAGQERVELAGGAAGLVLRIVDRATQQPVPQAEVFVLDADQGRRGEAGQHWAETVVRKGKAMRADARGRVLLPPIERSLRVAARAEGRFGCRQLDRRDRDEAKLELDRDQTLAVRVVGPRGEPVPDVRVKLCADQTRALAERTTVATDGEGRAGFRHVQLFRTQARGSRPARDADFVVAAEVPQAVAALARVPVDAIPTSPVELRLDPLGKLTIELRAPDGGPLRTACRVTVSAEKTAAPTTAGVDRVRNLESLTAQRQQKELGRTSVQFDRLGAGLTLSVSVDFDDNDFDFRERGVTGPAQNEHRRIELRMPSKFTVITGRVVLPDGSTSPLRTEMLVNGQEGRIEGERIATAADGAFELPLEIREPAAPYSLEVQATAADVPVGRTIALPVLQPGTRHDVGAIRLAALPLLAHGTVRDDRGEPIRGALVELQTFRPRAGDGGQWREDSYASSVRTAPDGTYRLFGEPRPLRMRLRARAGGHAPAESAEIAFGAEVDLVLERLGMITARGHAPAWLPRGALQALLLQDGRRVRREQPRTGRDGSFRLRLGNLPRGVYDLVFELRAIPRPLLVVAGVAVEPGSDARDPRLQDIDLRGSAYRFVVHAVDERGEPVRPGSPLLARLTGPDGQPRDVGFPWRGDRIELYTTDPSIPVVALSQGFRPAQTQLTAGETQLRLQRVHPIEVHLPGLRAHAGPGRRVRVSLVYEGDTGLPMQDFSATDQQRGRDRRYPRAQMGKSGGAWLGENDVVRVPLMLDGRYRVVARIYPTGAPGGPVSTALGTIPVALAGATMQRVTLVPPPAPIEQALAELQARGEQRR